MFCYVGCPECIDNCPECKLKDECGGYQCQYGMICELDGKHTKFCTGNRRDLIYTAELKDLA